MKVFCLFGRSAESASFERVYRRARRLPSRVGGAALAAGLAVMVGAWPGLMLAEQDAQPDEPAEASELEDLLDLIPGDRGGAAEEPDEDDLGLPPELAAEMEQEAEVAGEVPFSQTVQRLLDDPVIGERERVELKVFHGQWDELEVDELDVEQRAKLALLRYELDHDVFEDEQAPAMLVARAAYKRGDTERALAVLEEVAGKPAALLRAKALEASGALPQAVRVLRDELWDEPAEDAAAAVAHAEAIVMRARLEGRGADQWGRAMQLLGEARQAHDPLYWPAYVVEAELLWAKDNQPEAGEAIEQAMSLNPRAGRIWYTAGRMAARGFNFEAAEHAMGQLRQVNEEHVLADALEVHMLLVQRDPDGAREVLDGALERYPSHRELLALDVAVYMLALEYEQAEQALERFDAVAPGHPRALHVAGEYLSLARQYDVAEDMLRRAIERQPNDTAPRIELGMLLMQANKEREARQMLRTATQMDPFQRRASNTLRLVEDLLDYERIETEHFVITYKEGIDEVLARDMARYVEPMYERQTELFAHEPGQRTQIDLLPDQEWFGVRIAGIPEIWAMGAATGPVIAMIPPRDGPRQHGTFHWATVLEHEFAHTVTLSRTRNRIPHWFTEGLAVWAEVLERDANRSQLLDWAVREDELFGLEQISWGFIRPQTPRDRPLAYAQSDWMVRFIEDTWGRQALVELMEQHLEGVDNEQAVQRVLERDPDSFMSEFRQWAEQDIQSWGFGFPELGGAAGEVVGGGDSLGEDELAALIAEQGWDELDDERREALQAMREDADGHPAWLRHLAERALDGEDEALALEAVARYTEARPADPWGPQEMVRLALDMQDHDQAIAALAHLEARELQHGRWAHQLARLERGRGNLEEAGQWIERALYREPYNASYRELAATLALQREAMEEALHHLEAMAILEPDRQMHQRRLEALQQRMEVDGE